MQQLENYKSLLIGQLLVKVYHTNQGEGIEHLNGLGKAYYFSSVLELKNGQRFIFDNDWIDTWDASEPLFEVTHQNWHISNTIIFNNRIITDIILDQHKDLYIKLDNDVLIYHTTAYGDGLFIESFKKVFGKKGI